jgi:hypothetical protein
MFSRMSLVLLAATTALAGLAGSGSTASGAYPAYPAYCHPACAPPCRTREYTCCTFDGGCGGNGYMRAIDRAQWYNWNRNYAYTDYGQPTALLVPPTANLQTNWGWGVASSRISRIDHQFQRNFPGYGAFGGPFRPTPVWPSDTTQFGVYYVRGPW